MSTQVKTDNRRPWVTLRCKECKKERRAHKINNDPVGTKVVVMLCPECNSGDFDEPYYLDASGKEIPWTEEAVTPLPAKRKGAKK